jgi:hypothetical protein
MLNRMVAVADDAGSLLKKRKHFPPEEENAFVSNFEGEEIGLLDIVLLDGLVRRDLHNQ